MVGVASAFADKATISDVGLKVAYDSLLANSGYLEATGRSTADEEYVKLRINLAKEAFAKSL